MTQGNNFIITIFYNQNIDMNKYKNKKLVHDKIFSKYN